MFPLQAAVTVFFVSLCFPCMVETQEGVCSKTKRFEFVEKGGRMLLFERYEISVKQMFGLGALQTLMYISHL